MTEPLIHSHITDCLPDDHPLAYEQVSCDGKQPAPRGCWELLHAGNNESMQAWVETGKGNYCLPCFVATVRHHDRDGRPYYVLDEDWALPRGAS